MTDSIRSEMEKSGESWACSRLYLTGEEIQTLRDVYLDYVTRNSRSLLNECDTAIQVMEMIKKYDENK